MLSNNLKLAIRNIFRNPFYSTINILGLSIGITFSLLLYLNINDELAVDQFHENGDRIYHAYFNGLDENGGYTFTQPSSPYALYHTFSNIDGVEDAVFFDESADVVIEYDGKLVKESSAWGTSSMFNVFSFELLAGKVASDKQQQESVFISEAVAQRIFGENWEGNAIGEILKVNKELDWTVAGVFKNMGSNSSIKFEVLLNAARLPSLMNDPEWIDDWGAKRASVYAELSEGVDPAAIERQINLIYKDKPGYGIGGDAMTLHPLEKNYLWTAFENGIAVGGKIQYVKIFIWAAFFLLLIASINFINLSTAQASKRAKEVGVRKTIGARKIELVSQFLSETGLMVFIAIAIAIGFSFLLVPELNQLTGKALVLPFEEFYFLGSLFLLGIGLTIIAGLYPSFVLSKFKPIKVLKKDLRTGFSHKNIRRGLVIFQFVISTGLIIGTLLMNSQVDFLKERNLGVNRENIIHLNFPGPVKERFAPLKDKLIANSKIKDVIRTSSLPTNVDWIGVDFEWQGRDPDNGGYFYQMFTDFGFDKVFDLKMKEGRFFEEEMKSDLEGLVINEKALEYIQMENPVGKTVYDYDGTPMQIVGIVEDFNFRSLHHEIEPMMIRIKPAYTNHVFIQAESGDMDNTIAYIKNTWSAVIDDYPFEYDFLDDKYAKMYETETTTGKISSYLAIVAVIISCLGLLGLITFIAGQRTKEIGIRKVLGASVLSIIILLSKDFIKLIILGLCLAVPLAWYGVNSWLDNYAFQIDISWQSFFLAGLISIGIGLLIIGVQSMQAALANPVNSLKEE